MRGDKALPCLPQPLRGLGEEIRLVVAGGYMGRTGLQEPALFPLLTNAGLDPARGVQLQDRP